ncbi:hypothetical protein L914_11334, partial [Phytophthora nicotianae]
MNTPESAWGDLKDEDAVSKPTLLSTSDDEAELEELTGALLNDDARLIAETDRIVCRRRETVSSESALPLVFACPPELKEFSGKDDDEDRARAWFGKVKSAFVRDQLQTTRNAWCLVVCSLDRRATGTGNLVGPRGGNWRELLREFQVQFCGLGVSVARQYYHTRKRADETPLEYLYRLNVAGLRVKLRVKSGPSDVRREHVEHYSETLDDRDLADQLALLRISDADASDATKSAPTRKVEAVAITIQPDSDSDSGLSRSESDGDLRRIYLAATEGDSQTQVTAPDEPDRTMSGQTPPPRYSGPGQRSPHGRPQFQRCTHCGSHRHDDLHCWKRLTCQRCGKRSHPSDRCLFVCCGCGEIHDAGKCQMEEFYNLISQ